MLRIAAAKNVRDEQQQQQRRRRGSRDREASFLVLLVNFEDQLRKEEEAAAAAAGVEEKRSRVCSRECDPSPRLLSLSLIHPLGPFCSPTRLPSLLEPPENPRVFVPVCHNSREVSPLPAVDPCLR